MYPAGQACCAISDEATVPRWAEALRRTARGCLGRARAGEAGGSRRPGVAQSVAAGAWLPPGRAPGCGVNAWSAAYYSVASNRFQLSGPGLSRGHKHTDGDELGSAAPTRRSRPAVHTAGRRRVVLSGSRCTAGRPGGGGPGRVLSEPLSAVQSMCTGITESTAGQLTHSGLTHTVAQ
jgi:hypothetical protein